MSGTQSPHPGNTDHTRARNSGQTAPRSGRRRGRGGRGGRGGRDAAAAPVASTPSAPSASRQPEGSLAAPANERRARGRRHGFGGRHGHEVPPRRFGGHLNPEPEARPVIRADAPDFVPGQAAEPRQASKSTAAHLGTRIHQDISSLNYECTICTDDVLRSSRVWSCSLCWTVVHLSCAKQWHLNQMKQHQASEPASEPASSWRCPGCNSKLHEAPASYHCWCGKEVNPLPASTALPPHSCGQTCSKPRATCPHPCSLQCHAGPCPPCQLVGPSQPCFCGKQTCQKLCRETDYDSGWRCDAVCGDLLPCGQHSCPQPCHSGLCGDCTVQVDSRCYCGLVRQDMVCSLTAEPLQSYSVDDAAWFQGTFSCQAPCQRLFDCGLHKCSKTCHAQDQSPLHCLFAPDAVTRCPCGKTGLDDLVDSPRQSCQDNVPRCQEACHKALPCGHLCQAKCHAGDCGPCNEQVQVPCRCGRISTPSLCHQGIMENPLCMRTCQASLNCGRHKCGQHCCPAERKALERRGAKKKKRPGADASLVEPQHICIRTCGKLLKCGSHDCQHMCHRGPCPSCPEAIFQDISCHCGRTVLQPPQPCGTRPPECRFSCLKQPACGHPPVDHSCHPEEVPCPKCPFLVDRWCVCGKEKLRSQPCHLREAYCGRPCGKTLKCRLHVCKKRCHGPDECEDVGASDEACSQVCGKTKLFCEHPCQLVCHGPTPCNESATCFAKTMIKCPCGHRQIQSKCLASSSNPEPLKPDVKCDDECLRMDRNRRLAAALNVNPASHTDNHVPYSELTLRLFKENLAWAESQEREFRVFAQSVNEVRIRFKPMVSAYRQFIHALADDYGLESQSEDAEPHRYVVIYKTSRFVSAPSKTLAHCVKICDLQASEAAATATTWSPKSPAVEHQPFNSLLLISPRFGLTADEVSVVLHDDLTSQSSMKFVVSFLPTEEVLLRAVVQYSALVSPAAVEDSLGRLKARLAKTLERSAMAGNVIMCRTDPDDHVLQRENIATKNPLGWNAVAGRCAAKSDVATEGSLSSARGGPGRILLGLKKKQQQQQQQQQQTSAARGAASWAALGDDVEC
ncbi:hypothetical protein CDD82_6022 [Ophiocordyceps australis]|uniref:R3H domain-containing protein n=1 Tax=Ophiocordyceps australis TaxID=1399860 RepID=A0A2C5YYA9_9HYPO|nr:hypothetical protein CDD82_6022 [Ophiocordyceps australis]